MAASENQQTDIELYLNKENGSGRTSLILAIENKCHVDVIKLLIEKGADPTYTNSFGHTVLSFALSNGNKDVITLVIEEIGKHFASGKKTQSEKESKKESTEKKSRLRDD